ncbi:putative RNA methyltransferase [Streptacidiphilus fuscans]|uniref:Methyltransferase domain-containing protein n=1 Tax=Streptacidiphilus fuscans TaxID=2789292 RepID=A0A931BDJ1_9ACTN|nr:methyltransferase domain-containing protein [Streptacidiphilus fuscans]MBF9071475.1 methyltransferase domain-containing protein [Streptacidiphilus fuscans]
MPTTSVNPALQRVAAWLHCPVCAQELTLAQDGGALRCPARHSFDVAKQGYANLLPGGAHTGTGDTTAMVAARVDFLGAGHYAPIATALAEAVRAAVGETVGEAGVREDRAGRVVDLGAGTGHYLAAVLDAVPGATGLALDISKFALRRAAKAHPRAAAVVCDAWKPLPLRDGVADVVLNVFAPRRGEEIRRVLRPGGELLVVSPTPKHLRELVGELGLLGVDDRKDERLARTLVPHLSPAGARELTFGVRLSHAEVATVVGMGPSAWHTDADALVARIAALPDPVEVTASVTLSRFVHTPG